VVCSIRADQSLSLQLEQARRRLVKLEQPTPETNPKVHPRTWRKRIPEIERRRLRHLARQRELVPALERVIAVLGDWTPDNYDHDAAKRKIAEAEAFLAAISG
jgi:hypothetical protein